MRLTSGMAPLSAAPARAALLKGELANFAPFAAAAPAKAAYINFPFCRRRCFYCSFPISVVGDSASNAARAAEGYVDTVLREMEATREALAREKGSAVTDTLTSLYIGGGTPSLCPPELMGELIDSARELYGLAPDAEVCMEMDPGTFDEVQLRKFLDLGVNRVSMGVQAFDEDLLKACGRAHSLSDVYRAVELMHKVGMSNFGLDVIGGLPGQTMRQWEHSLGQAVDSGAAHVSVYDLQVEKGTAFGRWYEPGQTPLPSEELTADMYRAAHGTLSRAGFEHYEISNYARPGRQSRHNRVYWENRPFLAFGNGAASCLAGHRFSRPRGRGEYADWVDLLRARGWGVATGAKAATEVAKAAGEAGHQQMEVDQSLDAVMVGLRLSDGLNLSEFTERFGDPAAKRVMAGAEEALAAGLAEVVEERLRLTVPEGFLFSNSVISSIFAELQP